MHRTGQCPHWSPAMAGDAARPKGTRPPGRDVSCPDKVWPRDYQFKLLNLINRAWHCEVGLRRLGMCQDKTPYPVREGGLRKGSPRPGALGRAGRSWQGTRPANIFDAHPLCPGTKPPQFPTVCNRLIQIIQCSTAPRYSVDGGWYSKAVTRRSIEQCL